MSPWQPPIPRGALSSREALALGGAVFLVARCYDDVERDGSVLLSLASLAGDMGVSYSTMKAWARALRKSPIFTRSQDCGHSGVRLWFAREWLDWRQMARNAQGQNSDPEGFQGHAQGQSQGQNSNLEDAQGQPQGHAQGHAQGQNSDPHPLHGGTHGSRSSTSSDDDDDMRLETPRTPEGRPSSSSTQPAARAGGDEAGERTQQGADANLTERAAPSPPRSAPPPAPPALPPAIEQAFADWQGRAPESGDRKVLLSLLGDYGASWLESGIAASVAQNGKSLNYVRKMLAECRANGTQPGDPKPTTTEERNGTHNSPGPRSRGPSRRPVSPPLDEATQARYRAAPTLGELYPELRRVPRRTDRAGGSD